MKWYCMQHHLCSFWPHRILRPWYEGAHAISFPHAPYDPTCAGPFVVSLGAGCHMLNASCQQIALSHVYLPRRNPYRNAQPLPKKMSIIWKLTSDKMSWNGVRIVNVGLIRILDESAHTCLKPSHFDLFPILLRSLIIKVNNKLMNTLSSLVLGAMLLNWLLAVAPAADGWGCCWECEVEFILIDFYNYNLFECQQS